MKLSKNEYYDIKTLAKYFGISEATAYKRLLALKPLKKVFELRGRNNTRQVEKNVWLLGDVMELMKWKYGWEEPK